MPKHNGVLQDYEDRKTKAGERYTRFKIDDAWYNCFDKNVSKELKTYEGKPCSVELKVSGEFKNISKVYENFATETQQEVEVITPQSRPNTDRVDRAKALEIAKGDIEKAKVYFNYITKGE